jgi:general secretion pathway protein I
MTRQWLGPRLAVRGFTLIEVLVALTIASVALMAALRATGALVQSSEELRLRTLAQWSAENRLSLLRIQNDLPVIGRREFDCSQAEAALTCQEDVFAMPAPNFRRVEVSVFAVSDRHRVARLVGFLSKLQQ